MSIGQTIADQIGRPAFFMLGAKHIFRDSNSLSFKTGRVAKGFANYVKITLNPMDLYDMEFKKLHGESVKDIASVPNVYAEDMHKMIEKHTGLYTNL